LGLFAVAARQMIAIPAPGYGTYTIDPCAARCATAKSSPMGVMKDTINMTRFSTVEIDFIADDPGPSLLHCHHQDHQDEGFMGLVTNL
jgi:FtsP/CotA-like multicopper oxidase with cupredoxin domain